MDFFVQLVTVLSVLGSLIAYILQRQNKRFQNIDKHFQQLELKIESKINQLVQQKDCKDRRDNCPCCAQLKMVQKFVGK